MPTVTSGSLAAGDTATFSESFDTKNAGIGKTLGATGSVNDGDGGSDYNVSYQPSTVNVVYRLPITVTAGPNTKAYDGTTSATAVPAIAVSGGGSLPSGDTAAFTESYDTPAVGTGKTLTVSGSVNDGDGGADYSVTLVVQYGRRHHADGRPFRGHGHPGEHYGRQQLRPDRDGRGRRRQRGDQLRGHGELHQLRSAGAAPGRQRHLHAGVGHGRTCWPPWRRPAPGRSRSATRRTRRSRAPVPRSRSRRRRLRRWSSASSPAGAAAGATIARR